MDAVGLTIYMIDLRPCTFALSTSATLSRRNDDLEIRGMFANVWCFGDI